MSTETNSQTLGYKLKIDSIIVGETTFLEPAFVSYYEEHGYTGAMYPIRVLKIRLSSQEMLKIMRSDKVVNMGRKKLYETRISFTTFDDNGRVVRNPFDNTGVFYAMLVNQDMKGEFSDGVKKDKIGTSASDESNTENMLVLYREAELSFATSSLVNINLNSGKVFSTLLYAFNQTNVKHKLVISKPRVNPTVSNLLIPPMAFLDYLTFLDKEFGLYNTPYSCYIEDKTFYLTNTNNEIDIRTNDPFTLIVNTIKGKPSRQYNAGKSSTSAHIDSTAVKRENSAASASENDIVYKYPDGRTEHSNNESSRGSVVYLKHTMVPHIKRVSPLVREIATVQLSGYGDLKLNILSSVQLNDDREGPLKYRVASKILSIEGLNGVITTLRLFRNPNE